VAQNEDDLKSPWSVLLGDGIREGEMGVGVRERAIGEWSEICWVLYVPRDKIEKAGWGTVTVAAKVEPRSDPAIDEIDSGGWIAVHFSVMAAVE
jgi:hypothetical protein